MAREILGVDIGGVIISKTMEGDAYPSIPDSFEILRLLNETRFKDNIFLVSRVSSGIKAQNILSWLKGTHFYEKTGITRARVRFCRERYEKTPICQQLGITHFIDDRTEVLQHLYYAGILNLLLFQGTEDEIEQRKYLLAHLRRVASWQEVARALID